MQLKTVKYKLPKLTQIVYSIKILYNIKVSNWFIDKIENFQIRAYAGCESSSSAKKFPQKDWKKKIIFCQIGVGDFQCVFLNKL